MTAERKENARYVRIFGGVLWRAPSQNARKPKEWKIVGHYSKSDGQKNGLNLVHYQRAHGTAASLLMVYLANTLPCEAECLAGHAQAR